MKEKVVEPKEKMNFILILKQALWDPEVSDAEDITELEGLNKDELKEYKEAYNAIKKLEDKYGIEPKKIKKDIKKSPTIKNATITKGNNEKRKEEQANEKEDDRIHDR